MTNSPSDTPKLSWRFPRTFWIANCAELFERAAYYGMFIALVLYLTRRVGFTDIEAGYLAACFSSIIYLLPTFLGAMADRIGFRKALVIAFALLTAGYALLGAFQYKSTAIVALGMIMFGGAIVKPVISATVAKCSDDAHRVRAFSIFYQVVNIGAFFGKSIAKPLRTGIDLPFVGRLELGLEYINFYASLMAFCALWFVILFYRNVDAGGSAKSAREAGAGLLKVIRNFRFMALILIVAGFWVIQGQLYATMPKYILRLLGESAVPEYLANINPLVVVLLVVPITHLIRHFKPANAMAIGLFIIPLSALSISLSPVLQSVAGDSVGILGRFALHPLTVTVILGIALQGLAECFLSPKFLEYASKQAPKGEEGLYLGYQHLTTFFAWALGFGISGHLLENYCPDPRGLSTAAYRQWARGTDTGYRFELDAELSDALHAGPLVDSPLREPLEKQGIALQSFSQIEGAPLTGGDPAVLAAERFKYPQGLAAHPNGETIYWIDGFDAKLYSADFTAAADGIDNLTIEPASLDTNGAWTGVALDAGNEHLYLTDAKSDAIYRTNLGGFDVLRLPLDGVHQPRAIAVDPQRGKLYWSAPDGIHAASLEGAAASLLLGEQAGDAYGLAVSADDGKLYWIDRQAGAIRRCDPDGSGLEAALSRDLRDAWGLALDPTNKRFLWSTYALADLTAAADEGTWRIDGGSGEYEIKHADGGWLVYKRAHTLPDAYTRAHYIWYCFAGIGCLAFCAMVIYKVVTDRIDRRKATSESAAA